MKRKIGTLLEDDLYRRAKETARQQGRSVNALLTAALEQYLSGQTSGASTVAETKGIYKVSSKAVRLVLDEDLYDAG
jgi:hypothetical protein